MNFINEKAVVSCYVDAAAILLMVVLLVSVIFRSAHTFLKLKVEFVEYALMKCKDWL